MPNLSDSFRNSSNSTNLISVSKDDDTDNSIDSFGHEIDGSESIESSISTQSISRIEDEENKDAKKCLSTQ